MFRTISIAAFYFVLAGSAFPFRPLAADKGKETAVDTKGPGKPSNETSSPEKDGIRMIVRVPKAAIAGSPLLIEAKVINNSKVPIHLSWDTTDPRKVQTELTTKDGRAVPFTLYGRKTIEPTDPLDRLRKAVGAAHGWELPPGQTSDLSVPNLALFYDLTLPGEYNLTVSEFVDVYEKPRPKHMKLQVEKIPLTITEP